MRKQDKRTYITYDETPSVYDPKKLRQYTPSPLSKTISQPSHDEILNELESERFWDNPETNSKEEYYVPGEKIKVEKTSRVPIQSSFKGRTYTQYIPKEAIEKPLLSFFDDYQEDDKEIKEEGFGTPTSEDEIPKEESDNEEETDLHIRLNHIHPYIRKKIVPTIIRDQKRDNAIYSSQHVVIPKQHVMSIRIRKQIKDGYIGTSELEES
ncbi:hypothetical protein F8M41_019227 [Gigaspora margarita]|uniref:Uncharacterized protein n=1 Tax=Gigaspora margarita TaxID=4874 RepID=A0A8H4AK78_GIGMA|nr:hypothetical protein F8M41_019227 [Gigaspora margarita]